MITSSTFIPSQRAKDLLCMLWVEYGCWGQTAPILIELRKELGAAEYRLFEKDLQRLLYQRCARVAVEKIIRAAIARGEEQHRRYLKTTYPSA